MHQDRELPSIPATCGCQFQEAFVAMVLFVFELMEGIFAEKFSSLEVS